MFEKNDFSIFVGGWSYEGESLFHACNSIDIGENYCLNVLEFGCGDSTVKFYDILKAKLPNIKINYQCYENDPAFLILHPKIVCTLYHKDNIDSVCLPSEKYDLVLIDGPHGVDRMKWYAKVKHVIKKGTVILIDDWNHYSEFEESLVLEIGSCWDYDTVYLADFIFPVKSYKIVKITNSKEKSANINIIKFIREEKIDGFSKDGGTDKVCDHSYCLTLYPEILSPLIDCPCSILEIGTYKGGWAYILLKMLPYSNVTCVDIENLISDKIISRLSDKEISRLSFIEADGYSESFFSLISKNKYDLIFEDGPHSPETQMYAVKNFSRLLSEKGTLIIEDIQDYASLQNLINCVDNNLFDYHVVDMRHVVGRYDDLALVIRRKA